jgi:hypothetical protein
MAIQSNAHSSISRRKSSLEVDIRSIGQYITRVLRSPENSPLYSREHITASHKVTNLIREL